MCIIMYAQLFTFQQYFSLPITIIILILPTHYAQSDSEMYKVCNQTTTRACGRPIREGIGYPFWGDDILRPSYCGLDGFKLSCEDGDLIVNIGPDSKYRVVEINPSTSVLRLNYYDEPLCASRWINSTILNETLYDYGQNTEDLHLFHNCDAETNTTWIQYKLHCRGEDDDDPVYLVGKNSSPVDLEYMTASCNHTTFPVNTTGFEEYMKDVHNSAPLVNLYSVQFEVQYKNGKACNDCVITGGACWQGTYLNKGSTCLYSNGTVLSPYPQYDLTVPPPTPQPVITGKAKNLGLIIGIASGVVVGSMLLLLVLFVLYRRQKN